MSQIIGSTLPDDTTLSRYIQQRRDLAGGAIEGIASRINNLIIIPYEFPYAGSRAKTYEALVHELLHMVIGEYQGTGGHVGIARALGVYKDFTHLGAGIDRLNASAAIDEWLRGCFK